MEIYRKAVLSVTAAGVLLGFVPGVASGLRVPLDPQAKPAAKAAAPAAPKEEVEFPHMDQALAYLQAAQRQLQQAEPWFGGHREKAIPLVGKATDDVQAGISEYVAKHPSAVRNEINPDTIQVQAGHHFGEAMRLTQQAQAELNKASHIFYGKREEALTQVNAALAEMQAGVDYYKAHPRNK
jgi:hypothetical protein